MATPDSREIDTGGETTRSNGGFQIKRIQMSDAENNEILWCTNCSDEHWDKEEIQIRLPSTILLKKAVCREIEFSSEHAIQELRLEHNVFLHDHLIEEWNFFFGFVIPHSTNNSWQQVILSGPEVMDASILSGNVTIETSFYDKDIVLARSMWRIFYD